MVTFKLIVLVLSTFMARCTSAIPDSVVITDNKTSWTHLTVTWKPVVGAVTYNSSLNCSTSTFEKLSFVKNVTEAVFKNLPSNKSCIFKIYVVDNAGVVSNVTQLSFTSSPKPTAPIDFVITNHPDDGKSKLLLSWKEPVSLDAERLKTIKYRIFYTDALKIPIYKVDITDYMATNHTLRDLKRYTIYWIRISAYDETTKEIGLVAKGKLMTKHGRISNTSIALITIGLAIVSIILLAAATYMHFKKKYARL